VVGVFLCVFVFVVGGVGGGVVFACVCARAQFES